MELICGIDEAGRGPVIGPMVVAGVWIPGAAEEELLALNVKDSKKHSPRRREELSAVIADRFYYRLQVVAAEDIDSLRAAMTLNELEAHVFAKIGSEKRAGTYYLDSASTSETWFGERFQAGLPYDAAVVSRHEADDIYPVVSAASIMAKVERDRQVDMIAGELEPRLDLPLGSGYPSDARTRAFLKAWMQEYGDVPPHTRRSWKTVQKLKGELEQDTLF
ncbi:MAG: ribonuclease HII [Thermoplasmatota archaeon]